jgi:glycerol-3-phosphate acyltransferase PlsX
MPDLGDAFARALLGFTNPSIGLLNVGSEMQKGREDLKQAAQQLQDDPDPLHFTGFIEGMTSPLAPWMWW